MRAVTHLEKVITGEVSAVTHLEKVIAEETSAVTYTEKVIAGEATPIAHLQKVIAGVASPVTHLEQVWAGGSPTPSEHEYTGAVPVTITANGQPLIDYLISGNMEQSGTPTQQNPIQPQECGERTGNLWFYLPNTTINGVTLAYTNNKLVYSGLCNASGNLETSRVFAAGTYVFKANANHIPSNDSYACIQMLSQDGTIIAQVNNRDAVNGQASFTLTEQTTMKLRIRVQSGVNYDGFEIQPMLNTGSTALPYEPYGYKLDISSANTTTPVYLGEVETTRRIKKLVLDGTESVSKDTGQGPTLYFLRYKHIQINSYCTHLRSVSSKPQSGEFSTVAQYDGYIFMNFGADIMNAQPSGNTIEGFKEYLAAQYAAGTPVTVWYVLAEPTTGIVNEPIRKIGDYADTVSMEQAGVSIPTLNGQTVIDVDTTLKPSEVYIKYKG